MSEERQTMLVTVFAGEQYDPDWPPEDAAGFMAWFQAKLDTVPVEHRAGVYIELGSESLPTINIRYQRAETDEEMAARLARDARKRLSEEASERAAYERLKAKFEQG